MLTREGFLALLIEQAEGAGEVAAKKRRQLGILVYASVLAFVAFSCAAEGPSGLVVGLVFAAPFLLYGHHLRGDRVRVRVENGRLWVATEENPERALRPSELMWAELSSLHTRLGVRFDDGSELRITLPAIRGHLATPVGPRTFHWT